MAKTEDKKLLGGLAGIIAGVLAFIGLGFLAFYLYKRVQFRFVDASNSSWAGPQYEWMKGKSIPAEFKDRELLQLNSMSLIKAGEKVKVTYDDARAGRSGEFEVLYVPHSKVIVIDRAPSPSGGPWSGTVQLVK